MTENVNYRGLIR